MAPLDPACAIKSMNTHSKMAAHSLSCMDKIKEMSYRGTFVHCTTLASVIVVITYFRHFIPHSNLPDGTLLHLSAWGALTLAYTYYIECYLSVHTGQKPNTYA